MVSGGRRGSIVLAGERKGSSNHSGEWRGSGVIPGASSLLHLGLGQRENTETVAKLPQPAQPRYHARGARPEDHAEVPLFQQTCVRFKMRQFHSRLKSVCVPRCVTKVSMHLSISHSLCSAVHNERH